MAFGDVLQLRRMYPANSRVIDDVENDLFSLSWAPSVGKLAPEWAHLVGYQEPKEAKLYHYTQGLPCWYETKGMPEDAAWNEELKAMNSTVTWKALMGKSVHAAPVMRRLYERLTE